MNFMSFFSIIMTLLLALTSDSHFKQEKDLLYYRFKAIKAYKKKHYSAFLDYLKIANQFAPNNPAILCDLARAYALKGKSKLATEYLERSINMNEKSGI